MWKAWLTLPLIAALACGGDGDIEKRYKKAVAEQRAKSGAAAGEQLVSIGMSVGQSGKDVAIVYYSGGDRHDITGTARSMSGGGDRDYQIDGNATFLRAKDRSYGFRLAEPSSSNTRWKVHIYSDHFKIADNDNDVSPFRTKIESPERAKVEGPNDEPLGEVDFDGKNTVVKKSDGTVKLSKQTGALEPSYGVFLIDRMAIPEKYVVIAELMARNR